MEGLVVAAVPVALVVVAGGIALVSRTRRRRLRRLIDEYGIGVLGSGGPVLSKGSGGPVGGYGTYSGYSGGGHSGHDGRYGGGDGGGGSF